MKHPLFARVVTSCIGLSLVLSLGFTAPKKAEAQWIVSDPTNLIQNTLSAVAETAGHVKDWALDTLAWQVAKLAIQSLQKSLVNWINSGFQGSPGFVTDLKRNLRGVGDAVVNRFFYELAQQDITTSPHQDKILNVARLGYYLATSPESFYTKNPYTLNQVSPDARAFLEGDFTKGGWNAWFSTIINPQNNPYGASRLANEALTQVVADATGQKLQEFSWNQGMISWRGDCKQTKGDAAAAKVAQPDISKNPSIDDVGAAAEAEMNARISANQQARLSGEDPCISYEIETPGSLIAAQVNKAVGATTDQLVTADEFNEIIGALLNQLVLQVVGAGGNGGLKGASKPSAGGGASIVDRATDPNQQSGVTSSISQTFQNSLTNQKKQVIAFQESWQKIRTAAEAAKERCGSANGEPEKVITRANEQLAKAANVIIEFDKMQAKVDTANAAAGEQTAALLEVAKEYNDVFLPKIQAALTPEEIGEAQAQSTDTGDQKPASLYTKMTQLTIFRGCQIPNDS